MLMSQEQEPENRAQRISWMMRYYTATAIPFIYSFSGNCAASAPISKFMCLWAIYIFPGSVHIFPPAEKADPGQTHRGNIQFAHRHRHMNVEIGTETPIFLFWEYLIQIFGILSLQCRQIVVLRTLLVVSQLSWAHQLQYVKERGAGDPGGGRMGEERGDEYLIWVCLAMLAAAISFIF